ncbi:MAG: L-rhamnose isomerase [Planctomycetaceae bacterium]|nr:L-rhamnose isomerase [Planctomycetaceae bacterium]
MPIHSGRPDDDQAERILVALSQFRIETPSWGYADTGTRFGKFHQPAAAIDLDDKLADAGQVQRLTGCCPTVAVHVLWDFPKGSDPTQVVRRAAQYDVAIGSINPNVFQDQRYKLGSFGNPDAAVRQAAVQHCVDCIALAQQVGSRLISLWFADGTNYPGQDNTRARKRRFTEALQQVQQRLDADQLLLVEYKPFEPAFYQTDIADWGMAYLLAKSAGPNAKVLVDTGHHYLAQNIEQIVAWLLDEQMLGGFHFNDRRYADDDLTLGSIDPYQVFRIFHEIHSYAFDHGGIFPEIAYMIDQSHNLKPKLEAMVQTVMVAQELYAKAALVDHAALDVYQSHGDIVAAERLLQRAFMTDVTDAIVAWRRQRGLPDDPLDALRGSGYVEQAARERSERRAALGIGQSTSYA